MTAIDVLKEVVKILEGFVEDCRFEAEEIVTSVCGISKHRLNIESPLITEAQINRIFEIAEKRAQNYPLQYLLGSWEFYSLPFCVGEGVLIPRADTEILVEQALKFINGRSGLNIIDLCSGSGCVAIATEKNAKGNFVTALEKEQAAYRYLKKNIELNRSAVKPMLGDVFFPNAKEEYSLILSNPPYIKAEQLKHLQKEVLFEPVSALDGGKDGLIFYRAICEKWVPLIKHGGALMVEIGFDQRQEVTEIFQNAGLSSVECVKDYGGNDRVIIGKKS